MKIITLFLLLLTSLASYAQTSGDSLVIKWKKSFETGLNVNQASFSDNWTGGGVNSLALSSLFNGRILYEGKNFSFDNTLQLLYGFLKNGEQRFRKTTDRIYADSKLGYRLSKKWNAYVAVNFLSQFAPGYNFITGPLGDEQKQLISSFLAPGYLTSSMGLEYKPVDYFWLRVGLASVRQTFVIDTTIYQHIPENYGVPVHEKVRTEAALVLTASYDRDIAKNLHLKALVSSFSNYRNMAATDVRADLILTAKVNKFMNVNLSGILLYDQDQDYEVQYSEALALGIVFMWSQFEQKK